MCSVAAVPVCVCVALCLVACGADVPQGAATAGAPSPPPAGLDPGNRAVWIEGGRFVAGSDDWDESFPATSPFSRLDEDPREATVEGFWLQEHEVTNEEYRRFDPGHVHAEGTDRSPVANVTWGQAMAYARSLGGTLPTEVQWEYAARGPERREYPWGDEPPTCERAHYDECEPRTTVEVMSRTGDVTPQGLYDLAGNVREWVKPIWFDEARHPVNPDAIRVKGGSFAHLDFFLRGAAVTRYLGVDYNWDNIGFRVAWPSTWPE